MKTKTIIISSIALLLTVAIAISVFFIGKGDKVNAESSTTQVSTTTTTSTTETTTESTTESTNTTTSTTKKPPSNTNSTSSQTTTNSFKCSHPAAYSDSNSLYIKGKDSKAGFENRSVMFRGCEKESWVVWECDVCGAFPIIYEVLDVPGHDFGEEEVIKYPNLNANGYYGCRCKKIGCDEIKTTTAIPVRRGSYSTIDSRFKISVYADGSEHYHLYYPDSKNLTVLVRDERAYGKVPTITFDETTYCLTVIYETKSGGQEKFYNYLDKEIINKNYHYDVTLDDSGIGNVVYNSNFLV